MNKFVSRKLLVTVASAVGVSGNIADLTDVQLICLTALAAVYLVMQGHVDRHSSG